MNVWIFLMAALFAVTETAYFGNNLLPASSSELICDGIVLVLFALAVRFKPADRRTPEQAE